MNEKLVNRTRIIKKQLIILNKIKKLEKEIVRIEKNLSSKKNKRKELILSLNINKEEKRRTENE